MALLITIVSDANLYRIRCKSILLKSSGKSASEITEIFDVTVPTVYAWIKRYKENGINCLETRPGQGRKMDCSDKEAVRKAIEEDRQSVSKAHEAWEKAKSQRHYLQMFFRSILYTYKKEKLQELESLDSKGKIELYYADESHVCTDGYVPYGW